MTPATPRHWRAKGVLRIASCAVAVLLCGSSFADRPPQGAANADDDAPHSAFRTLFSAPLPALGPDSAQAAITDGPAWDDYTLEAVRDDGAAVPRLFLARVPADLPRLDSPEARKDAFVKMLLPLILAENERVSAERKHLLTLRDSVAAGGSLSGDDKAWLDDLAARYEVADDDDAAVVIARLERRVDIVPPSLAIGQAALETGWGTSAAARGQAMFGQMVFSDDGERAEVRRFERIAHAVRAYEHNLNTHRAYERFRARRAAAREQHVPLNGYQLALTLIRYSERKMDYVRDVRGIIKANKLQPLDAARLDDAPQLAGG